MLPVLTIILPLLSAGLVLGLSPISRARPYARYLALTGVGLTAILILALRWMEPAALVPSLWQPSLLFGTTLVLQSDVTVQPLALAMALAVFSATLVAVSRKEVARPRLTATLLVLLTVGFLALWAANILTVMICWALYDMLQAMGRIAAGDSARSAIRGLIFGNLATLFLWGGVILSNGGADGELWPLMTLGGTQLTFWTIAGLLRLWIYPFHLSAPDDLSAAPSLAALLFLGPIMGWGLWLRLALVNGGLPLAGGWVTTMAAVTLALGSFLAWSCDAPRSALPWIGVGTGGAILLAARLAGEGAAAVIAAGSLSWALGVTLLFLGRGEEGGGRRGALWWNIPLLVGALSLLGAPLTLGFLTGATFLGGLTQGGPARLGWAFVIGNLFLVPSLVRLLSSSSSPGLPDHRWSLVAREVGLGAPALLLIVAGLRPGLFTGGIQPPPVGALFTMPGPVGWLLWIVSLAGGGLLAWQERGLRPRIELLLKAIHDLLRLEWLYSAIVGALDRGLSVLRAADEVVGGAGALLWSWLLFLLLLLLVWGGA